VHFTHFICFTYTPSTFDLEKAYDRAAAIEAKNNAVGFDFFIPIKIKGAISFIAVQVKNIVQKKNAKESTLAMVFADSNIKDFEGFWIAVYLHLGRPKEATKVSYSSDKKCLRIHVSSIESIGWLDHVCNNCLITNCDVSHCIIVSLLCLSCTMIDWRAFQTQVSIRGISKSYTGDFTTGQKGQSRC
jgi:hypothetical protein